MYLETEYNRGGTRGRNVTYVELDGTQKEKREIAEMLNDAAKEAYISEGKAELRLMDVAFYVDVEDYWAEMADLEIKQVGCKFCGMVGKTKFVAKMFPEIDVAIWYVSCRCGARSGDHDTKKEAFESWTEVMR